MLECFYKNSLILRTCMTEEPFVHKKAFGDVLTNFEYHKKIGEMLFKLISIPRTRKNPRLSFSNDAPPGKNCYEF